MVLGCGRLGESGLLVTETTDLMNFLRTLKARRDRGTVRDPGSSWLPLRLSLDLVVGTVQGVL